MSKNDRPEPPQKMVVVESEDYDEDESEVFTFYVLTPEAVAAGGFGAFIEDESICTCSDRQSALAIAEAWNAYYIKN